MLGFWDLIPKSGVAFIFISVFAISVWDRYKHELPYSILWIVAAEILLFVICFFIADKEGDTKLKK